MVAQAAPATPMENVTTNSRSSTTFSALERHRKYNGVLLSPTARSRPENRL